MRIRHQMTRHARERSTARLLPPGIAQMILEYGASRDAGDGARKFALSSDSMAELSRDYGRELPKTLEPYRRRGAYVVAVADQIVTVAFAGKPLFN